MNMRGRWETYYCKAVLIHQKLRLKVERLRRVLDEIITELEPSAVLFRESPDTNYVVHCRLPKSLGDLLPGSKLYQQRDDFAWAIISPIHFGIGRQYHLAE